MRSGWRCTPRRWRAVASTSCSFVRAGACVVTACSLSAFAISLGLRSGLQALRPNRGGDLVERKMHCIKRLRERVTARAAEQQVVEFQIRVALLNRFSQIGRPQSAAAADAAQVRPAHRLDRSRFALCQTSRLWCAPSTPLCRVILLRKCLQISARLQHVIFHKARRIFSRNVSRIYTPLLGY